MDQTISETSTYRTKPIPTGLLAFEILPKIGLFSLLIDGFRETFENVVESAPIFFETSEIAL